VANTTAELIAWWMAGQLKQTILKHPGSRQLESLQVHVEENFGQWAICEIDLQ
jgi:6-pyruvoyltetrahydropterin/6-carboxytetrahydropterin synthase